MKANETLFDAVERVMQPRVPQFSEQDRLMSCPCDTCPEYDTPVLVAAGELDPAYCECGAELEEIGCAKCDQVATRIVNLGQSQIGFGPVEHWETIQEARCDKHR